VFRLHSIVLRQDEMFSLLYARQSWADVAGFHGFYDFHPPGIFVLTKVSHVLADEYIAGRAVSVLAAVLTLPCFYLLVTNLLDARSGLIATALLAIAPVHVLYAHVGRAYAMVMLLVVVSWLALVLYRQSGFERWAGLYGIAVVLAVYVDYSAIYALIPQAVVTGFVWWERRRQSHGLLIAVAVGMLAYAPWLITQFPDTVRLSNHYARRLDYLAADWQRLPTVPKDLILGPGTHHMHVWWQAPWTDQPGWRLALTILIGLVAIAGLFCLYRRPFTLFVVLMMTLGSAATAFLTSLISPGWDARTILPAIGGICILLVAPLADYRLPGWLNRVSTSAIVLVGLVWIAALPVNYSNRDRLYRFDQLTADLQALNSPSWPVLTYSTGGMDTDTLEIYGDGQFSGVRFLTFVDGPLEEQSAMSRWLDRGPSRLDVVEHGIAAYLDLNNPANDVFWFVTHRSPRDFADAFQEAGYFPVAEMDYNSLTMTLWAKPDAELGAPVVVPDGQWIADGNGGYRVVLPAGSGVVLAQIDPNQVAKVAITCRSATADTFQKIATPAYPPDAAGEARSLVGAYCDKRTATIAITVIGVSAEQLPAISIRLLPAVP
jgi:4-amino-4-deoxy-L-arabinose transferase-like glycosyltransferase